MEMVQNAGSSATAEVRPVDEEREGDGSRVDTAAEVSTQTERTCEGPPSSGWQPQAPTRRGAAGLLGDGLPREESGWQPQAQLGDGLPQECATAGLLGDGLPQECATAGLLGDGLPQERHGTCNESPTIPKACGLEAATRDPRADDRPMQQVPDAGHTPREGSEPEGFETAAQAVAALEARHGKRACQWAYFDAESTAVGVIVRWDKAGGKEIRPVSRVASGRWVIGGMPEPRPLYELPALLARTVETVYVTEGEKAADAAGWLGLLATTSPHGWGSPAKADWRPLAGREVVILPDNDEAGRRYAQTVASILLALVPPARVRIVELPGLPPKGDMYDWVTAATTGDTLELRGRLMALAVAAEPLPRPPRPERQAGRASAHLPMPDGAANLPAGVSPAEAGPAWGESTGGPLLQCFADVVPSSVRWLWPGRIALGRITLLVGRPGEGKSFLMTDFAARISTGRPWPDGAEGIDGSVIFICAEDDPADTLRPRLDAHGADVRRVHLLSTVRKRDSVGRTYDTSFTLTDVEALEFCLQTHLDCRLVVVDPIGSFLGNCGDSYRDNDVRAILDPIARLADLYGPAVLVIAHRRKDAGVTHADDLALGSRAFTGVARSVWHLSRDPHNKTRRLLLPGKNNLAAEGQGLAFTIAGDPACIQWEPVPVDLTATEALVDESSSSRDDCPCPLRDPVHDWLRELLVGGPMSATEVRREADNAGFAWRTVHRAKDDLGIRPVRPDPTGPWVWGLANA